MPRILVTALTNDYHKGVLNKSVLNKGVLSNIGTRFGKKLLRISAAALTSDRPNGKFVVVIMKESQQRASSGGPKMANDGHG